MQNEFFGVFLKSGLWFHENLWLRYTFVALFGILRSGKLKFLPTCSPAC